ncbi:hypothetical protein HAX54_018422 [Datura stramonium]|uniref:Uncharacterized protein n=1 Tax=Datura stramonium TaxID=4076 RepID=A0ABS8S1Q2_DATST|nr:hypothetical protein [Datura stramonium]
MVTSRLQAQVCNRCASSTLCCRRRLEREIGPSNVLEPLFATPPFRGSAATVHSLDSTVLSPYYCWCPPAVSTLQYSVGTPHLPIFSTDSSIPLLSSISPSACSSSILTPKSFLVTDYSRQLHPNLVNPLIPETESVAEKSARETLRLLISNSNQPSPQLIDLPLLCFLVVQNDFAIKSVVSLSEKPIGWVDKKQISIQELFVPMEKPGSSGESSLMTGL